MAPSALYAEKLPAGVCDGQLLMSSCSPRTRKTPKKPIKTEASHWLRFNLNRNTMTSTLIDSSIITARKENKTTSQTELQNQFSIF